MLSAWSACLCTAVKPSLQPLWMSLGHLPVLRCQHLLKCRHVLGFTHALYPTQSSLLYCFKWFNPKCSYSFSVENEIMWYNLQRRSRQCFFSSSGVVHNIWVCHSHHVINKIALSKASFTASFLSSLQFNIHTKCQTLWLIMCLQQKYLKAIVSKFANLLCKKRFS